MKGAMSFLHQALIFLAAAVVSVPIFKRLGLGSVLGYLAAGMVIGPWGVGLISDVESILHFAELGVVLLLFLIGLELQPSRLWELRRSVFGLGGAQVVATRGAAGGRGRWRSACGRPRRSSPGSGCRCPPRPSRSSCSRRRTS